jgi:pimeloyl-ACP methyl ester carboxylesterase
MRVIPYARNFHAAELTMKTILIVFAVFGIALAPLAVAGVKSVVLVHGAFADGSGWKAVATILKRDGYTVYVVQEPLTSWDADLAATRSVLDRAGPDQSGLNDSWPAEPSRRRSSCREVT